ncbi:P-loop containing nucleoside triphosphate hydrolase protein [Exidia glandulosa HHB12029]|uniref:p-loop containing nucleoside triphosphate hydrolase protein n=1 Tax=Exidia glandulosa HHB12029 TaxID=1314781 RepID=A0A165IHB4_EXIGL|nr:P-loop containing nucleoside triphosphate hydrolase protein [Exidia glandulosa HHB12029]
MYHLLKGLYQHLTRKDEFSVLILGLDGAGKTTFLEKIKTLFSDTPGLAPDKIGPTVGQNMGKITLPSTVLQFWDLGGQTSLRALWPRYYDECHAVAFVVDATDRDRLHEAWEVFDSVFSAPQILGVPLLLLANKQDHPESVSVEEIRESYDTWAAQHARDEAQREEDALDANERTPVAPQTGQRSASLEVIGMSAIEGTGVRAAVDWLFLRVQNSRRRETH